MIIFQQTRLKSSIAAHAQKSQLNIKIHLDFCDINFNHNVDQLLLLAIAKYQSVTKVFFLQILTLFVSYFHIIMNLAGALSQIKCFQADEKFTDTVLRFSDGLIRVHWGILEAHGQIWWTLARDTSIESIVEVILPEVAVAEGQIFVEEIYSNIQSFKLLNPNSDSTAPLTNLETDTNNNSYEMDIEQDQNVELVIRGSKALNVPPNVESNEVDSDHSVAPATR